MASLGVAPSDALLSRLAEARMKTDDLFRLLRPEALFDRPIAERHRNIFYLGHLEAFDWNLLSGRALGLKSFHPEFDKLFAFGIDPLGDGLLQTSRRIGHRCGRSVTTISKSASGWMQLWEKRCLPRNR